MPSFLLWTLVLVGLPLVAFAAARWSLDQIDEGASEYPARHPFA
jgi:hypothetical protein